MRLERAAVRWHGRLETEAPMLTLAEAQLAFAAKASLCAGERDAVEVLRARALGGRDGLPSYLPHVAAPKAIRPIASGARPKPESLRDPR